MAIYLVSKCVHYSHEPSLALGPILKQPESALTQEPLVKTIQIKVSIMIDPRSK